MKAPEPPAIPQQSTHERRHLAAVIVAVSSNRFQLNGLTKASSLIQTEAFRNKVVSELRLCAEFVDPLEIEEETLAEADHLQQALACRLSAHIERKLPHDREDLQCHWCWNFMAQRFPQIAGIMMVLGHASDDQKALSSADCLLAPGPRFWLVKEPNKAVKLEEGIHGYWCTIKSK